MDRRAFLGTVTSSLLAAPLAAAGQQARKVWRIGLLDSGTSNPSSGARWKAFRERLRELGYVDGESVVFEPRWGNEKYARLPSLVAEMVNLKVDIVVTASSQAALAAKRATNSIPIVTATGVDPVALGLVASLARPGGNVTGVTSIASELGGKRLELLKQLIPRASRVAVLRDVDNHASALQLRDTETAARAMGVVVHGVGVRGLENFDAAFLAIMRDHSEAVILLENTVFMANRRRLADLALMHRLPLVAISTEYAQAGALASYGTDYPDLFRRAAEYVDKILKGAKPADLPIEQPDKFGLVINLKTARALGLTIPPSLLQRADQLIE